MRLRDFLSSMTRDERERFASKCETSLGHLQNVMYGIKTCATDLAVSIERESRKKVTRPELRPEDWRRHWPELAKKARMSATNSKEKA